MILQFMTQKALDDLKLNFESYREHYVNQDKEWFEQYFEDTDGLVTYKEEFPDFQMNMALDQKQNPDYNVSDFENIKILYGALKDLPLSVAYSERFWAGLSHTILWDYIWYRRKAKIENGKDKDIKSSYLRIISGRRGVFVNCISRLWWAGYHTYDENREDPYELTKVLAQRAFPSQMVLLSSRNFTSNKAILRGILQALLEFDKQGYVVDRYSFETILTYLNNISALTILDFFTEDEIYHISKEQLARYIQLGLAKKKEIENKSYIQNNKEMQEKVVLAAESPTAKDMGKQKSPVYAGSFSVVKGKKDATTKSKRNRPITRTITIGKKRKKR